MEMFTVAIVISLGICCSASSISGYDNSSLASAEDTTTSDTGDTWITNTSIAISVFKTKNGEWNTKFFAYNKLRSTSRSLNLNLKKEVIQCGERKYLTLRGNLKDTDADDFADVSEDESVNNVEGHEESDKRCSEILTTADIASINDSLRENLMEARKSSERMMIIEDRLTSLENILTSINENKARDEKTMTTVKESQKNVENTLKNMEETINQLKTMLKSTPRCWYTLQFDATIKGKKVELSDDFRTATRSDPFESYEYASVTSNVHLKEDEVFQIRIDQTIDKWGEHGIAIGVLKEKKEEIKWKWNTFYDIKGTWAIKSWSYTRPGTSHTLKDNKVISENGYPLDTRHLPVGTLLGVSRRRNGNLHFYLNGKDMGAVFGGVPKDVYAFIDILYYVTKITITS